MNVLSKTQNTCSGANSYVGKSTAVNSLPDPSGSSDTLDSNAQSTQRVENDNSLLKLTFVTASAFILAGVAFLVSANTHVPSYVSAAPTSPATIELSPDQLKLKALLLLRSLPDYPTNTTYSAERTDINVNTFLLANRISDESVLAELQMQPTFADFNGLYFQDSALSGGTIAENSSTQSSSFHGVGFPHIETSDRPDSERYKPYKQLLSVVGENQEDIFAHIKCMGLSPEAVAARAEPYDERIFYLAVKHGLSASLIKAVVAKESCYNPKARSKVGAIGLMQLMPETAKWLKVTQPENVEQNLTAGVRYLAQLRERFGSNELALAAYNAGPGNVEKYDGIPPFAETQNYVKDVMHFYRGYVAANRFVNAMYDL